MDALISQDIRACGLQGSRPFTAQAHAKMSSARCPVSDRDYNVQEEVGMVQVGMNPGDWGAKIWLDTIDESFCWPSLDTQIRPLHCWKHLPSLLNCCASSSINFLPVISFSICVLLLQCPGTLSAVSLHHYQRILYRLSGSTACLGGRTQNGNLPESLLAERC